MKIRSVFINEFTGDQETVPYGVDCVEGYELFGYNIIFGGFVFMFEDDFQLLKVVEEISKRLVFVGLDDMEYSNNSKLCRGQGCDTLIEGGFPLCTECTGKAAAAGHLGQKFLYKCVECGAFQSVGKPNASCEVCDMAMEDYDPMDEHYVCSCGHYPHACVCENID